MSIFHNFPELPVEGETAFCKINEVYCCADARYGNISTFTNSIKNHPKINVTKDLHHHRVTDENISMYVEVQDNFLKKITSVWYKQGFLEALSVAADPNVNRESKFLAVTASYALKVANLFTAFRYFMQPHLKDIGPKIVSKYSRTRNWGQSPIKCIGWHPHTTKIAVATTDDNVRVYCSEVSFVSTLKCKAQGHVSSLNWRPFSASEIAVGCEQGVIVWTVDPNSMFTKPSSSNAIVLKRVAGLSPQLEKVWKVLHHGPPMQINNSFRLPDVKWSLQLMDTQIQPQIKEKSYLRLYVDVLLLVRTEIVTSPYTKCLCHPPSQTETENDTRLALQSGHSPVTDVSWSPNGDLLVSCSGADTSMLIWDVAMETAVPLRRVAGGGIVFARWSFDASKIFAATSSIIFRVWDTKTWTPERWCARGDRVVAACWGPKEMVLFAAKDEPIVYALANSGLLNGIQTNKAQPILDLTKVELSSGDLVGGPILDMCWDPSGKYLALMFEESAIVAVFSIAQLMLQLNVTPCCFVNGIEDEMPTTMAFQQNFTEGACLTIAWSSGRVQHFPIVYTNGY